MKSKRTSDVEGGAWWSSSKIRLIGFLFLVGSIMLVVWSRTGKNPLLTDAPNMARAIKDGDARTLMSYAISEERNCSGLTEDKVRRVWELLMKKHIESSRLAGKAPTELSSNLTQATAGYRFVTNEGHPWQLILIASQSDEGSKTWIVYNMLSLASVLDNVGDSPILTSTNSLRGLRKYRQGLERIGITKIMLNPGRCVTLDELDAIFSRGAKKSSTD